MATVYYTKKLDRDTFLNKVLLAHYGYLPTICKDEYGKPSFKDLSDGISISHDHGYVVVAIGDGDIGVDIQHIEYRKAIVKLFAPSEYTEDAYTFTRLWAVKEAYGKFVGVGLNKTILATDFSSCVDEELFIHNHLFYCVKDIEDCVCALCSKDSSIHFISVGGNN